MQSLPLSINYRCHKAAIAQAQEYNPEIQARPDAPDGVLEQLDLADMRTMVQPGTDVVLCRMTAPLVGEALRLIREGTPATVLGRELGTELIATVKRFGKPDDDSQTVLDALNQWAQNKVASLANRGRTAEAAAIQDRVDSLELFLTESATVSEAEASIKKVFGEAEKNKDAILLSTIHKAKGGEWDRVFLLFEDRLMPHPAAKQEWEIEQEYNLLYVAHTRSKLETYSVLTPDN